MRNISIPVFHQNGITPVLITVSDDATAEEVEAIARSAAAEVQQGGSVLITVKDNATGEGAHNHDFCLVDRRAFSAHWCAVRALRCILGSLRKKRRRAQVLARMGEQDTGGGLATDPLTVILRMPFGEPSEFRWEAVLPGDWIFVDERPAQVVRVAYDNSQGVVSLYCESPRGADGMYLSPTQTPEPFHMRANTHQAWLPSYLVSLYAQLMAERFDREISEDIRRHCGVLEPQPKPMTFAEWQQHAADEIEAARRRRE